MRKFSIDIDGKPFISERETFSFKITFVATMRYTDRLAFLDLGIYNLSRNTEIVQGKEIVLRAGYDEEYDQVFKGEIITVLKERDGANIITRVLCRSGSSHVRPSINVTLGKNSTIIQALKACADAWGVPLVVDESQFSDAKVFIRGYSMNGDIAKVLDSLASQFGFDWLQSSEALIVDRKNRETNSNPREVSLFTGMIGVPEAEGDVEGYFVRVNMRLSPRIRLKSNIDLKSEYASYSTGNFFITPPKNGGKVSGIYKVVELVHRGDSLGNRWQTEIRGQKV